MAMAGYLHQVTKALKKAGELKPKIKYLTDGKVYEYGENTSVDMNICNCIFIDDNPEFVPNRENFYGFDRSKYEILI